MTTFFFARRKKNKNAVIARANGAAVRDALRSKDERARARTIVCDA